MQRIFNPQGPGKIAQERCIMGHGSAESRCCSEVRREWRSSCAAGESASVRPPGAAGGGEPIRHTRTHRQPARYGYMS